MKTTVVYVDIESLLDIRGGILSFFYSPEELAGLVNSDDYNFRESDDFDVDTSDYSNLLSKAPKEILKYSLMTNVITVIKSKLLALEKRNTFSNESMESEVLINIYPFNLTTEERDSLVEAVFKKLGISVYISVIRLPPEKLSPYYIENSNIESLFIYDFSKWLNIHLPNLKPLKLKEATFYFPAIHRKLSEEEVKEEQETITGSGFKDVFSFTEFLLSNLININYLPILFYSNIIVVNRYLEENKDYIASSTLSDELDSDVTIDEETLNMIREATDGNISE